MCIHLKLNDSSVGFQRHREEITPKEKKDGVGEKKKKISLFWWTTICPTVRSTWADLKPLGRRRESPAERVKLRPLVWSIPESPFHSSPNDTAKLLGCAQILCSVWSWALYFRIFPTSMASSWKMGKIFLGFVNARTRHCLRWRHQRFGWKCRGVFQVGAGDCLGKLREFESFTSLFSVFILTLIFCSGLQRRVVIQWSAGFQSLASILSWNTLWSGESVKMGLKHKHRVQTDVAIVNKQSVPAYASLSTQSNHFTKRNILFFSFLFLLFKKKQKQNNWPLRTTCSFHKTFPNSRRQFSEQFGFNNLFLDYRRCLCSQQEEVTQRTLHFDNCCIKINCH